MTKTNCLALALLACAAPGFAQKIFRDHVHPHWFSGEDGVTNQFWYRLDSPGEKTEYVTVNVETGARQTASHRGSAGDDSLPVLRLPLRSRDSSVDTDVTFENHLSEMVRLFWIDSGGRRVPYGSIPAGEQHLQHTYAGHVWLVATGDTNVVAVYQAGETPGVAIIDGRPPDGPSQRSLGEGSSPQHAEAPPEISPDGKWRVFVRDNNLFLSDLTATNDTQLTFNGRSAYSYDRHNDEVGDDIELKEHWRNPEPQVFWSPDSKHFVAIRVKPGSDRRVYLIESSPEDQVQPKLDSYPYLKPGDNVPIRKPHLFEVGAPSTGPPSRCCNTGSRVPYIDSEQLPQRPGSS